MYCYIISVLWGIAAPRLVRRGRGGPHELLGLRELVLGGGGRLGEAAAEDGAGEARGGEAEGLGRAEHVLHLDLGAVGGAAEREGAGVDLRLLAAGVGEDDVVVGDQLDLERHLDRQLPEVASLLLHLGSAVGVVVSELCMGAADDDNAVVESISNGKFDRYGSLGAVRLEAVAGRDG